MSDVRYTCENPDCPGAGTRYDLSRDAEAICPKCGWMMYGHPANPNAPGLALA
jgi:hypothetical protein